MHSNSYNVLEYLKYILWIQFIKGMRKFKRLWIQFIICIWHEFGDDDHDHDYDDDNDAADDQGDGDGDGCDGHRLSWEFKL